MNSLTTFSGLRLADAEPTVFVADPDPATCESIRAIAAVMELRCEAYATSREFLEAFDPDRPGCLVLEIRIPGGNGLQIQKQLKDMGAALPIVFLTAYASVSIAVHAMRMGALHFLEKPLHERDLWAAIQEAIHIDRQRREAKSIEERVVERLRTLSEKELAVLKLLADCKSKTAMAQELEVSVRTIEHHRTQLMRKLKTNSAAGLLRFALTLNGSPRSLLEETPPVPRNGFAREDERGLNGGAPNDK